MATLSSPGVGSGLDVNGIVTQLVALERKPIGQLQAQTTTIQTKLSNPSELAKVFSSTISADTAEQGFAVRVKTLAAQLIASDGAITTRTKGLRDSVTNNKK